MLFNTGALWRSAGLAVLGLSVVALGGCELFNYRQAAGRSDCRLEDAETLRIEGLIDASMRECLEALDLSQVRELVVTTNGGDADASLEIGDMLARPDLHIVVEYACHSGCANYWLPLASKVTVRRGSIIILHGGLDPALARRMMAEGLAAHPDAREALGAAVGELLTRHLDYVERRNIHPGWLLYREGDPGEPIWGDYLSGELGWRGPRSRYLVAERVMIESCLPNVELVLEPGAHAELAWVNERVRNRFIGRDWASSGTLRCVEPEADQPR